MNYSILSNLDRKDKYNIENNAKVKETRYFFKKPSDEKELKGKVIENILQSYEYWKIENPYIPTMI